MRVGLYTPTVSDFDGVFADVGNSRAGSLNDIHIYNRRRRGGSLFGVLGSVLKHSLPFLRSVILPELGGFVKNLTDDVSNNVPIKSSLKRNMMQSAKNVGKRIARGGGEGARGGARRRRRVRGQKRSAVRKRKKSVGVTKRKKSKIKRKKGKKCHSKMRKNDIFDSGMFSDI